MNAKTKTILKFWELARAGKNVALDINLQTGEIAYRCTKSAAGIEGSGTPPIPMSDAWYRIMVSNNHVVTNF